MKFLQEKEHQTKLCRGVITLCQGFHGAGQRCAQRNESKVRSKTQTRAFQTNWFLCIFRSTLPSDLAIFRGKVIKFCFKNLGNPWVMQHCTPAESKNAGVFPDHKAKWSGKDLHPSNPTMHMTTGISTSCTEGLISKYPAQIPTCIHKGKLQKSNTLTDTDYSVWEIG